MAMSDWSERTRLLVTVGVTVLVNLGVWGFVYKAREDWKKKDAEKNNLTNVVKGLKAEADKLPDLQKQLDKLSDRKKKLESVLPPTPERDRFFTDFTQICEQRGVRYTSYTPRYDVPVQGLNPQNFKRDVYGTSYVGDFKSMVELVNYFEESYPRFIAIENLAINSANGGMNITGAKHTWSFNIVAYYYVPTQGP
ncbi:MAG: type 4a pilus biogenesis protein PilO [Planctomycetota bacterium]|nr:type 4a pilus biogenesis protein PilO [Planctomycetota bacterium]